MIGGEAPQFELPSLEGGELSLKDLLAGGPVLLAFFKVSCPTCQLTFPFLERLHQGRSENAPRVIGISQDDAADTRNFNRRYGISFPMLLDPSGEKPATR